jgi:hypothetical protein
VNFAIDADLFIVLTGAFTFFNLIATGYLYRNLGASLNISSPDPFSYLFFSQVLFAIIGSYLVVANLENSEWLSYLNKNDFKGTKFIVS